VLSRQACGDVLTKKSLDKHRNQCRDASFTCLDCMLHFHGNDYRSHTSCISEAQKYQGHLYREKSKGKADKRNSTHGTYDSHEMVPRRAYVEDAPEGDDSQAIAMIEVPPRAPTPPSATEPAENVNVFDFLVTEETPNGSKLALTTPHERYAMERSIHYGNGDSHSRFSQYSTNGSDSMSYGFSYGNAPVNPSFSRYDSWQNLTDAQQAQAIMPPPAYVTPAPKEHRRERRDISSNETSDKKRKRVHIEELDLSSSKRPSSRDEMMLDVHGATSNGRVLHSGLTGGLQKLITDPEFYADRIEAGPTPILSPIKRTRREDDSKKERRKTVYVSHIGSGPPRPSSTKPTEEKHRRPRSPERRYHHDDKRRRARSADRTYHDDRYHDDRHRHRTHRESTSSDEKPHRKQLKAIEYHPERPASVQPNGTNQLVTYKSRGDLFMSFITKGPDSERGCSINKVLKRYHRERDVRGEAKDDEDKELWKSLRLRRNERGEIVLFI
jgi:cell growth-regulating nucleolar protein